MAIDNMQGKVTMTGKMNEGANIPKPANLSGMNKLFTKKKQEPQQPAAAPVQQQVEQPAQNNLAEKIQNLTNEEKTVLATVLSPSVSNVLKKIEPSLSPLLDAAGTNEENMIIPVSVVKSFAVKRYGGQNETESVGNFLADLQQSVSNTMDQQSVPPDTQMAETENSMIQSKIDEIDSGIMET
jgi:methyltransferase-like protein